MPRGSRVEVAFDNGTLEMRDQLQVYSPLEAGLSGLALALLELRRL